MSGSSDQKGYYQCHFDVKVLHTNQGYLTNRAIREKASDTWQAQMLRFTWLIDREKMARKMIAWKSKPVITIIHKRKFE
jgi:hypothetical protein